MLRLSRIVVAGVAVVALGTGAAFAGARWVRGAPARVHRTPQVFAAVGSGLRVELRSVRTGAVTDSLGSLGTRWTNNGFAFSPNGRYVYFTLIPKSSPWSSLLLEQLSVSTQIRQLIGFGEEPAVSPDGRLLAYAEGENASAGLVVRNLASGQSRSLNVARALGGRTDMLQASLAWFGDGSRLAVFESCCPVAVSRMSPHPPSSGSSGLHLVVVSVPPRGRLSARAISLPPGTQMPGAIGTDGTRTDSLLISSLTGGARAAVYRLAPRADR